MEQGRIPDNERKRKQEEKRDEKGKDGMEYGGIKVGYMKENR